MEGGGPAIQGFMLIKGASQGNLTDTKQITEARVQMHNHLHNICYPSIGQTSQDYHNRHTHTPTVDLQLACWGTGPSVGLVQFPSKPITEGPVLKPSFPASQLNAQVPSKPTEGPVPQQGLVPQLKAHSSSPPRTIKGTGVCGFHTIYGSAEHENGTYHSFYSAMIWFMTSTTSLH